MWGRGGEASGVATEASLANFLTEQSGKPFPNVPKPTSAVARIMTVADAVSREVKARPALAVPA